MSGLEVVAEGEHGQGRMLSERYCSQWQRYLHRTVPLVNRSAIPMRLIACTALHFFHLFFCIIFSCIASPIIGARILRLWTASTSYCLGRISVTTCYQSTSLRYIYPFPPPIAVRTSWPPVLTDSPHYGFCPSLPSYSPVALSHRAECPPRRHFARLAHLCIRSCGLVGICSTYRPASRICR